MIIHTEVDYETGDTTVSIDLGDKIFKLKVNLKEIRNKIDLASDNILIQKATEAIAHAIGVDIKICDKKEAYMIIKGDVVLTCLKTGKEVRLYQDCMKSGDPKNKCEFFQHWGIEGCRITITCAYLDFEQYRKDVEKEAGVNEE